MILHGTRIVLRPYTLDDAVHTFRWKNDPETTKWMGRRFRRSFTLEDCRTSLAEVIDHPTDKAAFYAIADRDGGYLGGIDLTDIDPVGGNAVLSLVVGEAVNRNRGYGGEALKLLLGYAFGTLGLHKVSLTVAEGNEAAHRCYLRNGFRDEGRIRDHLFVDGRYVDLIPMGILATEFRPSTASAGAPPN